MKDHYAILVVDRHASPEEIRRAYRKLVTVYHPDVFSGSAKQAHEHTVDLNEAHTILMDQSKRRAYNIIYDAWRRNADSPQSTTARTHRAAEHSEHRSPSKEGAPSDSRAESKTSPGRAGQSSGVAWVSILFVCVMLALAVSLTQVAPSHPKEYVAEAQSGAGFTEQSKTGTNPDTSDQNKPATYIDYPRPRHLRRR